MKRRITGIFLVLVLCLSLLPAAALAAEEQYLALGDSITTGYGLGEGEQSFAQQVAASGGYTLTNEAEVGATTETLLTKLSSISDKVAAADLITLTIGGNDLMNALYDYLAAAYNEGKPEEQQLPAPVIQSMFTNGDASISELAAFVPYLSGFGKSAQATDALTAFAANLAAIVTAIKTANPDVTLLVINQYNPYSALAKSLASNPLLSGIAQDISDAFDTGVKALNVAIQTVADQAGFPVVDVYTAFETAVAGGENPCNPSIGSTVNLDFHPNAQGHNLIAQAIVAPAPTPTLPFTDVTETDWFYDEVLWAYANGVMDGVGDGKFDPSGAVSRAMVWTVLARMDGEAISGANWIAEARAWAMEEGVSDGTMAAESVTREQLATMLYRYAKAQGWDVSAGEETNILSYPDADQVSNWAMEAIQWACGSGIITSMDGKLNPKGSAPRCQLATMLMRFDAEKEA